MSPLLFPAFVLAALVGAGGGYLLHRRWRKARRVRKKREKAARRIPVRDQIDFFIQHDPKIGQHLNGLKAEGLIGSWEGADVPQPGDPVPDLRLKVLRGRGGDGADPPRNAEEGWLRLSSFAGYKPVVLIFGSYT